MIVTDPGFGSSLPPGLISDALTILGVGSFIVAALALWFGEWLIVIRIRDWLLRAPESPVFPEPAVSDPELEEDPDRW